MVTTHLFQAYPTFPEGELAKIRAAVVSSVSLAEVAKLLWSGPRGLGYLHMTPYNRTVQELMSGGSDPVITRKPEGAWTHAIWDKANAR